MICKSLQPGSVVRIMPPFTQGLDERYAVRVRIDSAYPTPDGSTLFFSSNGRLFRDDEVVYVESVPAVQSEGAD